MCAVVSSYGAQEWPRTMALFSIVAGWPAPRQRKARGAVRGRAEDRACGGPEPPTLQRTWRPSSLASPSTTCALTAVGGSEARTPLASSCRLSNYLKPVIEVLRFRVWSSRPLSSTTYERRKVFIRRIERSVSLRHSYRSASLLIRLRYLFTNMSTVASRL